MDETSLQSHLAFPIDTKGWFMDKVTLGIGSERLRSHSSHISNVLPSMIIRDIKILTSKLKTTMLVRRTEFTPNIQIYLILTNRKNIQIYASILPFFFN